MKTIIIFAAGSIANFVIAQIAAHPQIIDIVLGILVGALFALLLAVIFVGPTQTEQKPQARKPTQRKPRRIIEQTAPKDWTFTPINYEWSAA